MTWHRFHLSASSTRARSTCAKPVARRITTFRLLPQNTEIQRIFGIYSARHGRSVFPAEKNEIVKTSTSSRNITRKKKRAPLGPVSSKWREEYAEHDINIFSFGESVQSLIDFCTTMYGDLRRSVANSTTPPVAPRDPEPVAIAFESRYQYGDRSAGTYAR